MECTKLIKALNIIENYSFKGCYYPKIEIQSLVNILTEVIQELEFCLNEKSNNDRLKLCLLQLRCSIKRILDVLSDNTYLKKTDILKLLTKKINLCLKEILNIGGTETLPLSDMSYHTVMLEVTSALKSPQLPSNISSLLDNLLCTTLTIAKISVSEDFNEISSSCRNVLTAFSSMKVEASDNTNDYDCSYLLYHIHVLERKVNTAMIRLFLHIMSYPQETLKSLVKACGNNTKSEKLSKDLDDKISTFDLTCDRIGLIGNFAIMSCEQDSLKLKVKNCLANLEFCEEMLVPACIDFYLDPTNNKREFFKYLCSEWKSEVLQINNLLDSIVDPATFSLVAFEDLSDLLQIVKKSSDKSSYQLVQLFCQRCQKLVQFICNSPDCVTDKFVIDLKNSLESELKILNKRITSCNIPLADSDRCLEVLLSYVDQISEHLSKILVNYTAVNHDLTCSTVKDISANTSALSFSSQPFPQNSTLGVETKKWNVSYKENVQNEENKLLLDCYLKAANKNSPYVFTMYQKTPTKKKIRDHLAISLDVSKCLGESFDA